VTESRHSPGSSRASVRVCALLRNRSVQAPLDAGARRLRCPDQWSLELFVAAILPSSDTCQGPATLGRVQSRMAGGHRGQATRSALDGFRPTPDKRTRGMSPLSQGLSPGGRAARPRSRAGLKQERRGKRRSGGAQRCRLDDRKPHFGSRSVWVTIAGSFGHSGCAVSGPGRFACDIGRPRCGGTDRFR
jgi:hypothetical protein